MDNPSKEKIISDSESLGSQDSWSTENSDSQDSLDSIFMVDRFSSS